MQPLIQDIFPQIIDSSPYFPERFCDFSCMRFPFKTKSHINSFNVSKLQEMPKMFEAYLKWNFGNL